MSLHAMGDYERRRTGFEAVMRPRDLVEYDVVRAELAAGVYGPVPQWAWTGWAVIWAAMGRGVGSPGGYTGGHPLCYLQHAIELQHGVVKSYPPLVVSALDELRR